MPPTETGEAPSSAFNDFPPAVGAASDKGGTVFQGKATLPTSQTLSDSAVGKGSLQECHIVGSFRWLILSRLLRIWVVIRVLGAHTVHGSSALQPLLQGDQVLGPGVSRAVFEERIPFLSWQFGDDLAEKGV